MNFQTLNRQRKFILLAALAGLIAMFLPWVTVSADTAAADLTDSIFGKQAMSFSENGMHGSGIIVFLSYVFVVALLFTIILLANTPTGSMGFAKSSPGFGAWISLLASAAVLASAWLFRTPGYTVKDSIDQVKKNLTTPVK